MEGATASVELRQSRCASDFSGRTSFCNLIHRHTFHLITVIAALRDERFVEVELQQQLLQRASTKVTLSDEEAYL